MSSNNSFIFKAASVLFGHSDDEGNWAGTLGSQQPRPVTGWNRAATIILERDTLSLLCSVQPHHSLSWSTITRLEPASAGHVVLGTMAARPSAVPANTGCRSVCDGTIMVSGLQEMALCEDMVYSSSHPSHNTELPSRHVSIFRRSTTSDPRPLWKTVTR